MKCNDCPAYDSYKSQGGDKHWFDFGFCHTVKLTKNKNDICEVDHREPLRVADSRLDYNSNK